MRLALAVLLVLLGLLSPTPAQPADPMSGYEQAILELSNQAREQNGLPRLTGNERLQAVARGHSGEMARLNYFDHESPVPGRHFPWDRVNQIGLDSPTISENLYYTEGFPLQQIAAKAVDAWMHSAEHRRNLLATDVSLMGIGVVKSGEQIYVTQVFSAGLEPFAPGSGSP